MGDRRGLVYVEFLIAFPVVFLLFLAVVQLSLLGAASLVVRHAAYRAAREASLVLDDDPEEWDGSARRTLLQPGGRGGLFSASRWGSDGPGPRLKSIHRAAFLPLSVLAPDLDVGTDAAAGEAPSIADAALDSGLTRIATSVVYTPFATELQFAGKAEEGRITFAPGELVQVELRYEYFCTVPIVDRLICKSALGLDALDAVPGFSGSALGVLRSLTLEANAAMPMHAANYLYRSEHETR